MGKYVVEVWNIEEDEDEKLVKTFLGFWRGVDSKPTPLDKGFALQSAYIGQANTNLVQKRVKGVEIVTLQVGESQRNCLEFRIIPEIQSKHIGEADWNGKLS